MTVADLIAALQGMPQDAEVVKCYSRDGAWPDYHVQVAGARLQNAAAIPRGEREITYDLSGLTPDDIARSIVVVEIE